MAGGRSFYWLWAIVLPVPVGVVAFLGAAGLFEDEPWVLLVRLGLGLGAAIVMYHLAESYYLRREERGSKGK